jgi:hypothetical protein
MRKTLTIQIIQAQYEELSKLAAQNFNSVGAEVRRAVADYLRKHKGSEPREEKHECEHALRSC